MMTRWLLLFCVCCFAMVSCGPRLEPQVRQEFSEENPNAVIERVYPGDGDGGTVYYYIEYQENEIRQMQEWLLLKQTDGSWKIQRKTPLEKPPI